MNKINRKKKIMRAVRRSAEARKESNDSAHRKIMAKGPQCNCRYCPPWENDNKVARTPKRGAKKPRSKDKR